MEQIIVNDHIQNFPKKFKKIQDATQESGFDQASGPLLGSLLSTLVATKPNGKLLELGTGSGISTAWMLQGMDKESTLKTIDNEKELVSIAKKHLGHDKRVEFIVGAGEGLILETKKASIDFIFADTWPGKYNHLEQTLDLLKVGGIYLIDDMLPQENWSEEHRIKADNLGNYLANRKDFLMTRMCWSTGIIICTKR